MDQDLKVMFIGSGAMVSNFFLPACLNTKGLAPAAIFGRDLSNLKNIASRYSIPHCFTDPDSLFKFDAEIAVIALPPQLHASFVERALMKGMHVLVEKPAFLKIDQGEKLSALAKEKGRSVEVNMTLRFLPIVQAMKQASLAHLKGPIQRAEVFYRVPSPAKKWYFDPALSGGGAAISIGVHAADLMCFLLNRNIQKIEFASMKRKWFHKTEDEAVFTGYFSELEKCCCNISWLSKEFSVKVLIEDAQNLLELYLSKKNAEIFINGNLYQSSADAWKENLSQNSLSGLADHIRNGSSSLSGLEQHRRVLNPLLSAYEAHRRKTRC